MKKKIILSESQVDSLFSKVIKEIGETVSPFDFEKLPEDVYNTLFDEYDDYTYKTFDWNEKRDEMGDMFGEWLKDHKNNVIWSNLNDIISKVTQDMIIKKRVKVAEQKLEAFEELIKPVLGNEVLIPALSEFEAAVLWNPNATPESIQKGLQDAKNIINAQGDIDYSKTTKSKVFKGDTLSIPAFKKFAENNPEYKGVYNDWKKLHDEHFELMVHDYHAFRNSTPIDKMRELRNALLNIKKKYK